MHCIMQCTVIPCTAPLALSCPGMIPLQWIWAPNDRAAATTSRYYSSGHAGDEIACVSLSLHCLICVFRRALTQQSRPIKWSYDWANLSQASGICVFISLLSLHLYLCLYLCTCLRYTDTAKASYEMQVELRQQLSGFVYLCLHVYYRVSHLYLWWRIFLS